MTCKNGVIAFGDRADELSFGQSRAAGQTNLASATLDQWWTAVSNGIQTSSKHQVLIFVHAFNNSAADAIERARAIANATRFDGPVIAFIWPSKESVFKYWVDETNADWSTSYFRWLLDSVVSSPITSSVIVVSHSMGNRITVAEVRELLEAHPSEARKIEHFLLASPDVDRDALGRDLPSDYMLLPDVTIYASAKDTALKISSSSLFHGYPRAGYLVSGAFLANAANAKLVDTTDVRHHDLADHSDFIASPEGAADLCRILNGIDPAAGRTSAGPNMWKLVRDPHVQDLCADQGKDAAATYVSNELSRGGEKSPTPRCSCGRAASRRFNAPARPKRRLTDARAH